MVLLYCYFCIRYDATELDREANSLTELRTRDETKEFFLSHISPRHCTGEEGTIKTELGRIPHQTFFLVTSLQSFPFILSLDVG